MIEFEFRFDDFTRMADRLGAARDQVPFAISVALNEAVEKTRSRLVRETWPRAVTVRKTTFINAALTTRDGRATKRNLKVAITDRLGRAHLAVHAIGGTKQAKGKFAVPTKAVRRTAGGVVASQRPGALARKVVKGNLIFQAQGRGKAARLRLMYRLMPQTRQPKDVPFIADFRQSMLDEVRASFPAAMARAMATRR